jgi:hypothetical protein
MSASERVTTVLERLGAVDRRWIFLFIAVAVSIPLALRRPASVAPSPIVQDLFDAIDSLPAGSRVVLSLDYAPSTVPENDPMAHAVARHVLKKNQKLYVMTLWSTGPPLIRRLLDEVVTVDFPDLVYGEDYVNLGYKVGNQGVIHSITTDFRGQFTSDAGYGEENPVRAVDEVPMLEGITVLGDFDFVVPIGSGYPGVKEWVQFGGDPVGIPIGGGVTAVEAPLLYPYYPKQLQGLMGGLLGAAEYEALLISHFPEFEEAARVALVRMFPQTVAHLVIVVFVVLGNISYFLTRARTRK